jgi:predicted Zn-dependent protease with MMP-like domain
VSGNGSDIDHFLDEAWDMIEDDDLEGAEEILAQVREAAPDDPGVLELEAELALTEDNGLAALAAYERWADLEPDDPLPVIRAAEVHLELLEDPRRAARMLREVLADYELEAVEEADGRHLLGVALEERGDRKGMVREWLAVLRLDALTEPRRPRMAPEQFEHVAADALAELPEDLRRALANVPVLVHDRPSEEMVLDGVDPRILGLFTGLAMPDQSVLGGLPHTGTILLFQRNLERETRDLDDLADEIRITVAHETAHYIGLDEDDLDRLGLG